MSAEVVCAELEPEVCRSKAAETPNTLLQLGSEWNKDVTEGAATAAPVYLALQPARSSDVLDVRSLTQLSSIPPSVRSAFALQPPRLEAWLQFAGSSPAAWSCLGPPWTIRPGCKG